MSDDGRQVRSMANAWTLAVLIPACIAAGYLLGSWLDAKLSSAPWLTIAGTILGVAAGFVSMFRIGLRGKL